MPTGSPLPGSAPRILDNKTVSLPRWGKAACTGGQRASFTASRFHSGNRKFFPSNQWDWIIGFLKIIIKMRKLSGVTWASWLKRQSWESNSLEEASDTKQPNLPFYRRENRSLERPGGLLGVPEVWLSLGHSLLSSPSITQMLPELKWELIQMQDHSLGEWALPPLDHISGYHRIHFLKNLFIWLCRALVGAREIFVVSWDISLWRMDSLVGAQAPEAAARGLTSCNSRALEHRVNSCGPRA